MREFGFRGYVWPFFSALLLFGAGYYLGSSKQGGSGPERSSEPSVPYSVPPQSAKTTVAKDEALEKRSIPSTQEFTGGTAIGKIQAPRVSSGTMREMLDGFLSEPNPVFKSAKLAEAMKELSEENLNEALEVFESIPFGFENAQEYRMFLYAWSQFDPLGAIDYCKSRASGIGAGFAVSGVIEGWAAQNPQEALQWVERPDNSGMAKLYNFGLVKGWASRDLEAASAYVLSMKEGEETEKLTGILTDFYGRRGFENASAWAESIENPKFKEAAFLKLSRSLARDNPRQVAGWLEGHSDGKYAVKAFESLGARWSETDPEAAITYFTELTKGKTQEVGVKSVIGNWAKQDPLAAGEWLNARPAGPELDSALMEYATMVSIKDGAAAMEWAVSISDAKLQQSAIRKVGQEWYRQDKESVEAWLPRSGLEESMQKSIRNPPKKNWWQKLSDD